MIWSLEDFGAFLDYASRHRMAPLFEIAAGTGMRRGELCGLPWTNVDLDAGSIHVTTARVQAGWTVVKGGPKTDAGYRRVLLIAQDVATLKAAGAQVSGVFPGGLHPDSHPPFPGSPSRRPTCRAC